MNIETVKQRSDSYLVNGNIQIPFTSGNMDCRMVLDWIEQGNIPEPEFTPQELKKQQIDALKQNTKVAIESGITLTVNNEKRSYPTDTSSQINMMGLIARSQLLGVSGEPYKFWCGVNDVWARRPHTLQELQTVGIAITDHVIALQEKYETDINSL